LLYQGLTEVLSGGLGKAHFNVRKLKKLFLLFPPTGRALANSSFEKADY